MDETKPRKQEPLSEIGEVKRIQLQPGDVLVVKLKKEFTQVAMARIIDCVRDTFPGHKIVFVENDIDLTIVSRHSPQEPKKVYADGGWVSLQEYLARTSPPNPPETPDR